MLKIFTITILQLKKQREKLNKINCQSHLLKGMIKSFPIFSLIDSIINIRIPNVQY